MIWLRLIIITSSSLSLSFSFSLFSSFSSFFLSSPSSSTIMPEENPLFISNYLSFKIKLSQTTLEGRSSSIHFTRDRTWLIGEVAELPLQPVQILHYRFKSPCVFFFVSVILDLNQREVVQRPLVNSFNSVSELDLGFTAVSVEIPSTKTMLLRIYKKVFFSQ